jgi:nucleotide-binding universal stress UspA family protein
VIVPLDGSALAETVLAHAVELARPLGIEVVLMRVFGVPTPVFAEDYGPYVEELWTQLEEETQKYLAEKKQQLLAQGLTHVTTTATAGFPAEKIIDAARERNDAWSRCAPTRAAASTASSWAASPTASCAMAAIRC